MNIGFIGLGKLGLSTAIAIADKGHHVLGFDTSPTPWLALLKHVRMPTLEPQSQSILEKWGSHVAEKITKVTLEDMAKVADLIFIAVPTPHQREFEGVTPLGTERADFSYYHLIKAVDDLVVEARGRAINIGVISTTLPGTVRRELIGRIPSNAGLCYNPLFIGMGTVVQDYYSPEFVLIGNGSDHTAELLKAFYATIHSKPIHVVDLETAELVKVCYNTFITGKIAFVNTVTEIAHKTGASAENAMRILGEATDRLISTKYLKPGGADSGPCHPRDNIAMSYLARKLNLSCDLFGGLMQARENYCKWIASLLEAEKLPVVLLGTAFKSEVALQDGSWVLLVAHLLRQRGIEPTLWDPLIDAEREWSTPSVFCIGTWHAKLFEFEYPPGSVVLDVWGHCPEGGDQVRIIKLGRP